MRKTLSSRSISSVIAWLSASRYETVGISGLVGGGHHVGGGGQRRLVSERDRLVDFALAALVDRGQLALGRAELLGQNHARVGHRVALFPLLDLFFGPVLPRIRHGMAAEAIGLDLDERRHAVFARPPHRFAHTLANSQNVFAV